MFVITKKINSFKTDETGSIAIISAISTLLIFILVGVALDFSRLTSLKHDTQDALDRAALASAIHMTTSALTEPSLGQRKKDAEEIAKAHFAAFLETEPHEATAFEINFPGNKEVQLVSNLEVKPYLLSMLGQQTLGIKTVSGVNIGDVQDTDIDIAIISDATGSMATTLAAIQDNMKDFTADLNIVLQSRNIEVGTVRVKFVFYRDYMMDNHTDWTGPTMAPDTVNREWGAMYTSRFYDLPTEKDTMDAYVDNFVAMGGGDIDESALEAIWYALDDPNWRHGSKTVRAIILWTDAPPRPFSDKEDTYLDPAIGGFWEDWIVSNLGSQMSDMTKIQREQFMVDNFYPSDAPTTTDALKNIYDAFHAENSRGEEDVNTMTINVLNDCVSVSTCGEWTDIATWDGVDYQYDTGTNTISEIYQKILDQTADTVEKQLLTKDLAIQY